MAKDSPDSGAQTTAGFELPHQLVFEVVPRPVDSPVQSMPLALRIRGPASQRASGGSVYYEMNHDQMRQLAEYLLREAQS